MRKKMNVLSVLLIFLSVLSGVKAKTNSIDIPKSAFLAAVNSQARNLELFLDTMGPFKNAGSDSATWYYDGSYAQLPTGQRISFPIPRIKVTGVTRRYELFVNNFKTDSISFSRQGSLWKIRVTAHDNEKALMVGCINRRKDRPCKAHVLKHTAAIRSFYIDFFFRMTFSGSRVTLVPHDVQMDFDYKIHSLLLNTAAKIVNYFFNIKNAARSALKEKVLGALDSDGVKKYLSADLDSLIFDKLFNFLPTSLSDRLSFIKDHIELTSIVELSSVFRVTFSYPDIVTGSIVQSVSLSPITRDMTRTCPYNYGFRAKIRTSGKVAGVAYLQYSDGTAGKPVPFAMNGAGEKTSLFAMSVDGSAGSIAKSGSVRLVLAFTGFPPQAYTRLSPYTSFIARCRSSGSGIGGVTGNIQRN